MSLKILSLIFDLVDRSLDGIKLSLDLLLNNEPKIRQKLIISFPEEECFPNFNMTSSRLDRSLETVCVKVD